ncbi:non-specific lipid-transfer protein 1-like [Phragmites australis]|uniref:non-specific lipid-transfer protein 1-like n=1 Tax=Phragmites australis TaxID=29695 RepID=UPI002D79925C|nr:non-specific lipid-transfer protein 1-like [Phragmites australis]
MAAPRFATLALAVLLATAVVAPPATVRAAMSCSTVYNTLMPCLPYVQMGGARPPQDCCGGIRTLLSQASSTPDRRTICGCLKNVANGSSGGSYIDRAAALPSKCGVTLPYKISTNVNCNTIN